MLADAVERFYGGPLGVDMLERLSRPPEVLRPAPIVGWVLGVLDETLRVIAGQDHLVAQPIGVDLDRHVHQPTHPYRTCRRIP